MAGTATPIFPQTVKNWVAQINNAAGTTAQSLVTGATNGSKVESLIVSSSDTTARDLQLTLVISSVSYVLGTISIPITAGFVDTVPSVDILRSALIPGLAFDSNGNRYLYVASGAVLYVATLVAVTSGKLVQAIAQGGDF